jgi:hypothetical protein
MADPVDILTIHSVRIERIIRRSDARISAEFLCGQWWCCEAWITFPGFIAFINTRPTSMTPEQAHTVAISLQMAIDWIAQESSWKVSKT